MLTDIWHSGEGGWALFTVTVTFVAPTDTDPEPFAHAVADALMGHDHVVTVHVDARGYPAVYRVDVRRDERAAMEAAALAPARAVAARLGATTEVHRLAAAP